MDRVIIKKAGTWETGTPEQIDEFINKLNKLQDEYWNIVGNDSVMDGIDKALREAEQLKNPNYPSGE